MSYNNMQLLVQKACLFIRVGSLELNRSLFTFIFLKVVMFFFNNCIAQKATIGPEKKTSTTLDLLAFLEKHFNKPDPLLHTK